MNDPMILRLHWGSYCALRHYATHACSSQLTRQPAKYSRRYSQGAANESANQAANEAAVRPADEACQRRSTLAKKEGNEAASSQSNRRRPFLPATSQLRRFSAHSAHDRRARTGPHVPARRRGGGSARRFRAGLPSGRRTRTNSGFFPRRSSSSRHPPSPSGQRSAGGSTKRVTSGNFTATAPLRSLHDRRARTGPHLPQAGEGVGPDVFGRVSPRADEKGQILDFFPRRSSSSRHPPSPSGQSSAGGSTKRVNNSVAPMCNRGANAPAGGQGPFRSSACNLSWKHEAVRGKVPVRTF